MENILAGVAFVAAVVLGLLLMQAVKKNYKQHDDY